MNIDTTKPHIGRIYDYVLGGHHNYEADRQAAQQMLKLFPAYPKWARLNRWFLQLVGQQWADAGYDRVLDLASGLPTQGHLDEYLPSARILFSDFDPLSVSHAQQLLADKPEMRYVQADLREPGPLFETASEFFGAQRKVAIGCIGVLYLLSDDYVRDLMKRLHDWCAPGSTLAFTFFHIVEDENAPATHAALKKLGELARISIISRSEERMRELVGPWRVTDVKDAETWLEVDPVVTEEERALRNLKIYGAIAQY